MLARRLKATLLAGAAWFSPGSVQSVESTIRIGSLARRCQAERERLGLTLKQAAAQLKVPQYRLKAIEDGHISEFRGDILMKYRDMLGLHDWIERWAEANPGLARKLGVADGRAVRHSCLRGT